METPEPQIELQFETPSREAPEPAYAVGHCRPPLHSRWKPGQSGNPKGRPPGPRTLRGDRLSAMVEKCLEREVKSRGPAGGRRRQVRLAELVVLCLAEAAEEGDVRAMSELMRAIRALGKRERRGAN